MIELNSARHHKFVEKHDRPIRESTTANCAFRVAQIDDRNHQNFRRIGRFCNDRPQLVDLFADSTVVHRINFRVLFCGPQSTLRTFLSIGSGYLCAHSCMSRTVKQSKRFALLFIREKPGGPPTPGPLSHRKQILQMWNTTLFGVRAMRTRRLSATFVPPFIYQPPHLLHPLCPRCRSRRTQNALDSSRLSAIALLFIYFSSLHRQHVYW